ncbi:hypothetical protein HDU76_011709 [Blyttiomyces sp. JEL0837]|nr:hypothetical protein HDU76_011709 [Blyttiomyces sp. JEL0837]
MHTPTTTAASSRPSKSSSMSSSSSTSSNTSSRSPLPPKPPSLTITITTTLLIALQLLSLPAPIKAIDTSSAYLDIFSTPKFQVLFGSGNPGSQPALRESDLGELRLLDPSLILIPSGGQKYLCKLPSLEDIEKENSAKNVPETSLAIRKKKVHSAVALLEPMKSSPCLYWVQGWWTYEFCYKRHVRQFHPLTPEEEKITPRHKIQNYIIGKYPGDIPDSALSTNTKESTANQNPNPEDKALEPVVLGPTDSELVERDHEDVVSVYLKQRWGGGTPCDVNDAGPRAVEIQYHCSPNEYIQQVRETGSCRYLMIINTPRLCMDPFRPRSKLAEPSTQIVCDPVLPDSDMTEDSESSKALGIDGGSSSSSGSSSQQQPNAIKKFVEERLLAQSQGQGQGGQQSTTGGTESYVNLRGLSGKNMRPARNSLKEVPVPVQDPVIVGKERQLSQEQLQKIVAAGGGQLDPTAALLASLFPGVGNVAGAAIVAGGAPGGAGAPAAAAGGAAAPRAGAANPVVQPVQIMMRSAKDKKKLEEMSDKEKAESGIDVDDPMMIVIDEDLTNIDEVVAKTSKAIREAVKARGGVGGELDPEIEAAMHEALQKMIKNGGVAGAGGGGKNSDWQIVKGNSKKVLGEDGEEEEEIDFTLINVKSESVGEGTSESSERSESSKSSKSSSSGKKKNKNKAWKALVKD